MEVLRFLMVGVVLLPGLFGLNAAPVAAADISTLFGKADEVWDAQISPDGRHIALGCGVRVLAGVCIYDLVNPAKSQIVYPGDEFRVQDFYWAGDNFLVTNVSAMVDIVTSQGKREYDLRRAISYDLTTQESAILLRDAPPSTDLTHIIGTCENNPDMVVMSLTLRSDEPARMGSLVGRRNSGVRTTLYEVNLKTGRGKARRQQNSSIMQTVLDRNCEPFIYVIYNDQLQDFEIQLADGRRSVFAMDDVAFMPLTVMGATTARDALIVQADFNDTYGMHTLSLEDGSLTPIALDGRELGRMGVVRDEFSDTVIGFSGTEDVEQHYYIDKELASLQQNLAKVLGGATIRLTSFTRDRSIVTLVAEEAGRPSTFYLFNTAQKQLSPLGNVAPQLEGKPLSQVEAISYAARDGLRIPGYLTLPPGKRRSDGPFPMIVLPHGGPESRATAKFDWWSQAYATAGYAVLQPNFRGSAGYGQAFRDAGFGEFGGKMIEDIIDAINWAKTTGLADSRGVCVAGASYGGYAALMTALKAPDTVGCVVAVAPVTDIFSHMARFDRSTESYRYWARYVGEERLPDEASQNAIRPDARTGEFSMPVLLIHGKDDHVVRLGQSQRFVTAWGQREGLRFVEMEGQDHYLASTSARTTVLRESLALFSAHHPAN